MSKVQILVEQFKRCEAQKALLAGSSSGEEFYNQLYAGFETAEQLQLDDKEKALIKRFIPFYERARQYETP